MTLQRLLDLAGSALNWRRPSPTPTPTPTSGGFWSPNTDQGIILNPSGSVLGASDTQLPPGSTTNGGNPPPSGDTAPSGPSAEELAERARRNRIDSYRAQAGNIRSQAESTFNDLLKAVNAYRERAKQQYSNAGQEIVDRASEILGSNARTAREASGEARTRGRALGLGDSSKFKLQNRVQGELASTQGNTIARRGQEERANQSLYDERQDQAQDQENQANTYLKGARDRATTLENSGYDLAEENYQGALNDIINYNRQLAAINPVQAGGISQYAPSFSNIPNTLNGVVSGITGSQSTATDTAANPASSVNWLDLLRRGAGIFL